MTTASASDERTAEPPEGRVALVTGGSRGIGRATAIRLARDHAAVAITYRSAEDAARSAAAEIEAAGAQSLVIECDLAEPAVGSKLVSDVVSAFGRIDSVVNNAGTAERHDFLDLDLAAWRHALDVNLTSVFVIAQAAAREMVGRGGSIVNVGSPAATDGGGTGAHYAASKAGLIGLTAHATRALGRHHIRVNIVDPYAIDTDMMRGAAGTGPIVPPSPMGRLGGPDEAAEVIAFLCSPAASFVSGVTIRVSGGG